MSEQHVFEIKIGDWSGDGHGQCDAYRVSSNKPVDAAREAYFAAKGRLPSHVCPEEFLNRYRDGSLIPERIYSDILTLGFDFLEGVERDGPDDASLEDRLENAYIDTAKMCEYVMWYLKQGDPELELKLLPAVESLAFYGHDSQGRHIGFIGYSLLGN